MAGLAAVTTRIQLFATCAVLALPPPITARMAVTIDSIAPGRFGVNIISGWQRAEYAQMGLWPGADHYTRRYEYCGEYVTILRDLWSTGRSDLKGRFFTMEDCRCSPLPSRPIPIISAGQSGGGTRFAALHADYNFRASIGVNRPTAVAESVAMLVQATRESGRDCGALILTMIIADETDAAAMAKWEHYKTGTDLVALGARAEQAGDDPSKDPYAQANRHKLEDEILPTNQGVLIGSYASVARMLDELAAVPGVRGVMMTFDHFVIGMEQFGTRIMPLMTSRPPA
jgi:pyrimidine oxygenase